MFNNYQNNNPLLNEKNFKIEDDFINNDINFTTPPLKKSKTIEDYTKEYLELKKENIKLKKEIIDNNNDILKFKNEINELNDIIIKYKNHKIEFNNESLEIKKLQILIKTNEENYLTKINEIKNSNLIQIQKIENKYKNQISNTIPIPIQNIENKYKNEINNLNQKINSLIQENNNYLKFNDSIIKKTERKSIYDKQLKNINNNNNYSYLLNYQDPIMKHHIELINKLNLIKNNYCNEENLKIKIIEEIKKNNLKYQNKNYRVDKVIINNKNEIELTYENNNHLI